MKPNENLKGDIFQKYQIFYLSRNGKQGGGLAIGISKEIESTLMREGDDHVEALVVQIVIDKLSIRVVRIFEVFRRRSHKSWVNGSGAPHSNGC